MHQEEATGLPKNQAKEEKTTIKLTAEQRDRIERGYAMVYTGERGAEFYIENVLDAYGRPSEKHRGEVYVYGPDDNLVDRGEGTYELFQSLEEAERYCDSVDPKPEEPAVYYVRFGTGAGDFETATLEEAMEAADAAACYTQNDIVIEDGCEREIARRVWYGVEFDEDEHDDDDPICFGDSGYYGDWC